MRPMANALSRPMMQQGTPMNALAPQQQVAPPQMQGRGPQPSMPTQEMLDEAWARNPTDMVGEQIDQIVRQSGGALVAPWDRQPQQRPMQQPYR